MDGNILLKIRKIIFLKKLYSGTKKNYSKKKNIYIIANSKWLANCAKKSELTKECNIRTIYNPLNTREWRKLNEKKSKNILKLNQKKKVYFVWCSWWIQKL